MNTQTFVRAPKREYQQLVNEIVRWAGLNYTIEVYEADMMNAIATMNREGRPVIVYGKQLMDEMAAKSTWAVIAIFAHEVAHHYNEDLQGKYLAQLAGIGYVRDQKSHRKELNADYFAGVVLRYKGAKIKDATDLFRAIPGLFKESATHPHPEKRAQALGKGWVDAHNELEPWNKLELVAPKPPVAQASSGGGFFGLFLLLAAGAAIVSIANSKD